MEIPKPLGIALIIVLAAALLPLPYGYYMLLRVVVCVGAAYLAVAAFRARTTGLAWLWAGIALLFNPIFPLYLGREIWTVVDLAVIVLVGAVLYKAGRGKQSKDAQ